MRRGRAQRGDDAGVLTTGLHTGRHFAGLGDNLGQAVGDVPRRRGQLVLPDAVDDGGVGALGGAGTRKCVQVAREERQVSGAAALSRDVQQVTWCPRRPIAHHRGVRERSYATCSTCSTYATYATFAVVTVALQASLG
ncbi:hypothetical protein GCM10022420_000440 [Streptomyces iranensis]